MITIKVEKLANGMIKLIGEESIIHVHRTNIRLTDYGHDCWNQKE